jgi:DNA-3-methyladenine glycosylase II
MASIHCTLALPPGFRVADILEFHRRDPQAFSERVENNVLTKGMIWGKPGSLPDSKFSATAG